jgi:hypothetical protein
LNVVEALVGLRLNLNRGIVGAVLVLDGEAALRLGHLQVLLDQTAALVLRLHVHVFRIRIYLVSSTSVRPAIAKVRKGGHRPGSKLTRFGQPARSACGCPRPCFREASLRWGRSFCPCL